MRAMSHLKFYFRPRRLSGLVIRRAPSADSRWSALEGLCGKVDERPFFGRCLQFVGVNNEREPFFFLFSLVALVLLESDEHVVSAYTGCFEGPSW